MATFALKVRDDDPVAIFLAKQENKSEFLRELVQAYLDDHNGKPGVNRREPDAPFGGISLKELQEAVYQGTKRALREVKIAVPTAAALNSVEEDELEPEAETQITGDAAVTADPEKTEHAKDLFLMQFGN